MIKIDDWVIEKGEKAQGKIKITGYGISNAGNCDMRSERRTDDTDHSGNTQCGVCRNPGGNGTCKRISTGRTEGEM